MSFQAWRPSPALAPWVAFYWHADLPVKEGPDAERVLPDGGMQLIVNLRDAPMRVYDRDDVTRVVATPSVIVTGPAERFALISRADTARTAGVAFRPAGAAAFLDEPASELIDRDVDVASLWGAALADELRNRVLGADTPRGAARALDAVLLRRLSARRAPPAAIVWAARELRRVPATTPVASLVDGIGLSHHRFLEQFRAAIGLAPKRFARLQRFQAVLREAHALDERAWADLAAACGYADQSHLVRDFRTFSGLTPEQYWRRRTGFVNHVDEC